MDVGAHQGGSLARFARDGWEVFAFEPDRENFRILSERFAGRDEVRIDPRAVTDVDGSRVAFYSSSTSDGIGSLVAFHESHRSAGEVETVTLSSFLTSKGISTVDFLKIDAEAYDLPVLRGYPWDASSPRVVLCEFEDRKSRLVGFDHRDLAAFLEERGYRILVSEWHPVTEYGSTHAWRRFFVWPHSHPAADAWGNLIATRDPGLFSRMLRWAGPGLEQADSKYGASGSGAAGRS